jgi:integrase
LTRLGRPKSKRLKLPNGAGSVIQRKDGWWMARFTAPDPETGKSVRKSLYGRTEQEARATLIKALNDREEGRLVLTRGRALSLERWVERWLASRQRRPSTMKTDREVLELHVLPALGKVPLRDLRPGHIRGLMNARRAAGASPRSCNKIREVVRKVLNAVNREHPGYLPFNAAELVEPLPQLRVRKATIVEPEQVHLLVDRAGDHRDGPFWIFVLATGARLGEGLGLAWEDVNLQDQQVFIRRELQYLRGQWHVLPPKTRKSERPIPLPEIACAGLERHRDLQAEQRRKASLWDIRYGNLVFSTDVGHPLDPSNLRRRLYAVERELGLPRLGPHELGRHGCASFLADQNVSPAVAMAILGHANIATTMEIYTHVLPKAMREAAEAIDRVLTPPDSSV